MQHFAHYGLHQAHSTENISFHFFCIHMYRPDLGGLGSHPTTECKSYVGATRSDRSVITGPCWDPYWIVSVLSPILFIVLIVKAILLIIKDELFRKFFIIHILAVIVSSYWVVVHTMNDHTVCFI